MFDAGEQPLSLPLPAEGFAVSSYTRPKVAPDRYVEVARALRSVTGDLVGQRILARSDGTTGKLYWRGQLTKVHPHQEPGRRRTEPADPPSELTAYARRDVDALRHRSIAHSDHLGYTAVAGTSVALDQDAEGLLAARLVRRHGADHVDEACRRALEAEAVNVGLIDRMLTRGLDGRPTAPDRDREPVCPWQQGLHHQEALMSPANRATTGRTTTPEPIEVSAEFKAPPRRLKLGRLLDTLPERLALARSEQLPHHDFLETLLTDEVTRHDRQSALVRSKLAHQEPGMHLDAWDESTKVTYDRQLWAELTSQRFVADSYNVLIMGPVGVEKTFLANALGHAAVRRKYAERTERTDKLFKRLKAARLDHTYDEEMRELYRVELLILDDLALLDAVQTKDITS